MTETNERFYRLIARIRRFEEIVLENFPKGIFWGTTHTYIGQEANAVGVLSHLSENDIVFSNHRSHGHFIAYGGDMYALFAELMGKPDGVCGGRGGSQHLHWKNFYSNGIQGGIVPIACGMALAEKFKGTRAVTVVFMGDGTMGEGVVYESFNMASLWQIPILFVVENNRIAQTTPIEMTVAGKIIDRFKAFAIPVKELDTSDVLEIYEAAATLIDTIRSGGNPQALILHTYRFGPHSKGDDTRDAKMMREIMNSRDPLRIHGKRIPMKQREKIMQEVQEELDVIFQRALKAPVSSINDENNSSSSVESI